MCVDQSCDLVFVTTEPLQDAGFLVRDRVGRFYPSKVIGPYFCKKYPQRTKEGFYICQVGFEIPDGVEFVRGDWWYLEIRYAPGSELKSLFFDETRCKDKTLLVERSVVNLVDQDRVRTRSELEVSRSRESPLGELAESVLGVLGTAYNHYCVPPNCPIE